MPIPMKKTPPRVAPTPMPALAPVESWLVPCTTGEVWVVLVVDGGDDAVIGLKLASGL